MSLKPDLFEGLRFDLTKPLNHNFALSHSIFMGNIDVPTANPSQVGRRPSPAAWFWWWFHHLATLQQRVAALLQLTRCIVTLRRWQSVRIRLSA